MGNRLSAIDRHMNVTRVRVNDLFAYYVYRPNTTGGAEKEKTNTYTYIHTHAYIHTYVSTYVGSVSYVCVFPVHGFVRASEVARGTRCIGSPLPVFRISKA